MRAVLVVLAILAALNVGIVGGKALRRLPTSVTPREAGALGVAKNAVDYGGQLTKVPRLLWLHDDGDGHYSAKYDVTVEGVGRETYVVTMIRSDWQVTSVQAGSP